MDYYVSKNPQDNGDHEVHTSSCSHLPNSENRTYLGNFATCAPAVIKAKTIYPKSDGCYFCSNDCHTS